MATSAQLTILSLSYPFGLISLLSPLVIDSSVPCRKSLKLQDSVLLSSVLQQKLTCSGFWYDPFSSSSNLIIIPSSKYKDFSVGSYYFFFKLTVLSSATKVISYSFSSITVQAAFNSSMDAYFSKFPLPCKMSSLGPTVFGTKFSSLGFSSLGSAVSYPSLDSTLSFGAFSEFC